MSAGRIVAALSASVAVGGCVVAVLALGHAANAPAAAPSSATSAPPTPRPAVISTTADAAVSGPASVPAASPPSSLSVTASAVPTRSVVVPAVVAPAVASAPATTPVHAVSPAPVTQASAPRPAPASAPAPTHAATTPAPRPAPAGHAAPAGQRLPLGYSTGTATRVITVTSGSASSTTATLQAWTKVSGGWARYGTAVTAHVGAAGIGTPSEFVSRTPAGSFTLTQAFGRLSNPGTPLPYFATTPSDYWISDPGPLYNTHQRCGSCGYNDGTNERLYYETPYYNYAVVINTPSGASAYPHGSAFFLHVTDGQPTAGCVAIPQNRLVTLMRWLTPSAHPRILIGVV